MEFELIDDVPHDTVLRAGLDLQRQGKLDVAGNFFKRFSADHPSDPFGHFFFGIVSYQQGQLQLALPALERAVSCSPLRAAFWCMLGRVLHASKHLMPAEACLQRALTLAPGHLDALAELGQLLSELERHDEAEKALRTAVLRRPSDPRLLVRLAAVLERAGNREEARATYRQALVYDPANAEANNNLALILHSEGELEQAQGLLERFLAVHPDHAEVHYTLALAHAGRGNLEKAEASYRRAITLRPRYFEALNNLGNLYVRTGRLESGISYLLKALNVVPTRSFVYRNICHALDQAGRRGEAIDLLRDRIASVPSLGELRPLYANYLAVERRLDEALTELEAFLKVHPDAFDAYVVLGLVYRERGLLNQALKAYRRATELAPLSPVAWANYAAGLSALEQWDEAETVLRNALKQWPEEPELELRLANLVSERGRHPEAIELFEQIRAKRQPTPHLLSDYSMALRRAGRHSFAVEQLKLAVQSYPGNAYLWCNLGTVRMDLGEIPEALRDLEHALTLHPNLVVARWNKSHCLLLLGRLQEGFAEYEARMDRSAPREMNCRHDALGLPLWSGQPLAGKRLVVIGEQGLGDQLQFLRFVPQLCFLADSVDLVLRPELHALVGSVPNVGRLLSAVPKNQYDYYVRLMSLPHLLGLTRPAELTVATPYLKPPPARLAKWQAEVNKLGAGTRIGLAWSGFARHPNDRYRSIPSRELPPLANPYVQWCSLHKRLPGDIPPFPCADLGAQFVDLADTAAVMTHLDLVITVDTSVAHVAGALGVPVWLLLPANPDWRWGNVGEQTPWYPSMRLFRQSELGDWGPVLQKVRFELDSFARPRKPGG